MPVTTALCFMFHELAVNPDIQTTLFKEIDSLRDGDAPLERSRYLDMVVAETLRRWSPLPVSEHICTKSSSFEDGDGTRIHLRAGERTFIPIYAIQMDENHFSGAEKFDPERFSPANKANIQPNTYLPFATASGAAHTLSDTMIKAFAFHLLAQFTIDKNFRTQDPLELKSSIYQMEADGGFSIDLRRRH